LPAGRPSPIDKVIGKKPDGTPITVAERMVNLVRLGNFVEHASAACGISKETHYEWVRVAARVNLAWNGDPDLTKITPHERRCVEYSDAVDQAQGEYFAADMRKLHEIGQGGIVRSRVVEKYAVEKNEQGEEVQVLLERTVTEDETLPNAAVIMWRLTRRAPKFFGNRLAIAHEDDDPGKLDERSELTALADSMEAYLLGRAEAEGKKTTRRRKAAT